MKDHIRLLEERVKELVSQNFKLVQKLTEAEESKVNAEILEENQLADGDKNNSDEQTCNPQFKTAKQRVPNKIETVVNAKSTDNQISRLLPPSSAKAATQASKLKAPSKFNAT